MIYQDDKNRRGINFREVQVKDQKRMFYYNYDILKEMSEVPLQFIIGAECFIEAEIGCNMRNLYEIM